MDNIYFDSFFFFVPYRLLWDNWERFMGAQDDPGDSIAYTIPEWSSNTDIDMTDVGDGSDYRALADYMGVPHKSSVNLTEMSALPFRAYNLIFNEWFRDQNLQDSVPVETGNGPDIPWTQYELLKRGKKTRLFHISTTLAPERYGRIISANRVSTSHRHWPSKWGSLGHGLPGRTRNR